jgi:hypothetical protein
MCGEYHKHKSCFGVFIKFLLYFSVHFLAQHMCIQLLYLVQRSQEYCSDSNIWLLLLTLYIMQSASADIVTHHSASYKVADSGLILCSHITDFRIEQNGTSSSFTGRDHVMVLAAESNCWTACAGSWNPQDNQILILSDLYSWEKEMFISTP